MNSARNAAVIISMLSLDGLNTIAAINLPIDQSGAIPSRLSETGAFLDIRTLAPHPDLLPYELNLSFWSDGAEKRRWIALPGRGENESNRIQFSPNGAWTFPEGTIFIKHFEFPTGKEIPARSNNRRIETRFLIRNSTGGVYGVTYKWRPDNSDADLLTTNTMELVRVNTGSDVRSQTWYYPSRVDCLACHTATAGHVLGVNTRQLNCNSTDRVTGAAKNQLRLWNEKEVFAPALNDSDIHRSPALPNVHDRSQSLQVRARAYLDVNCGYCHRPGGTVANFDLRFETPIERQHVIGGPVLIDHGIDRARVVAPNDIWRSILFMRVNTTGPLKMPPIGRHTVDADGVELLRSWIESLPGPPVLEPPVISPSGGIHDRPVVTVVLNHSDPDAIVRYTLNGRVPGPTAPVYKEPLELSDPATVRARAYRTGFTPSITVQETFVPRR